MDDQSKSIMNVPGQASANEGQYFDGRDAGVLIRALLADTPLNGIPPEVAGPYGELIANLVLARNGGGITGVRGVWNNLVRCQPELAGLVAGDIAAPTPLDAVMATFNRWLFLPDPGLIYAVLGTLAANRMSGDPVWLMLVGASSSGKTEGLLSLARLPHVSNSHFDF